MAVPAVIKEQGNLGLILIGDGRFGNGRGMIDSDGSEQVLHPMANEFTISVLVATDWSTFKWRPRLNHCRGAGEYQPRSRGHRSAAAVPRQQSCLGRADPGAIA